MLRNRFSKALHHMDNCSDVCNSSPNLVVFPGSGDPVCATIHTNTLIVQLDEPWVVSHMFRFRHPNMRVFPSNSYQPCRDFCRAQHQNVARGKQSALSYEGLAMVAL